MNLAFLDLRSNPLFTGAEQDRNFSRLVSSCPKLLQLNGVDLAESEEGDQTVVNTAEADEGLVLRLKECIVERSRVRHQGDRVTLEHGWEQKKLKLDAIKASMNDKFKFNK